MGKNDRGRGRLTSRTLCAASVLAALLAVPCLAQDPSGAPSGTAPSSTAFDDAFPSSPGTTAAPRVPLRTAPGEWDGGFESRPAPPGGRFEGQASSSAGIPGPGRSFLTSLVIPGGGQWLQEQRRSYVYAGLELVGWIAFAHGRHQGGAFRDEYRDLAWRSARLYQSGDRVVSDFRYYESLGSFASSGSWDRDPTAEGLQPENDPDTFNGSVWLLASQLFLSGEGAEGDPEAVRMALEYYQENAYPPELAWDWGGNTFQLERYRELIEKSDDSFRRATVVLGGIIANHVLSAVDGFLSARISSTPRPSEGFPSAGSTAGRWTLELRLNSLP